MVPKPVKKLGALGAVILATEVFNHFFDFVLFPFVIAYFGVTYGGALMLMSILVLNYYGVHLYRIVGIGEIIAYLDNVRDGEAFTKWEKLLKWVLKLGFVPAFIGLSIDDPVKGFVFARGGTLKPSFSRDDWGVFILSNLIGGGVWIGFWATGIELGKLLWKLSGLS